MTDEKAEWYWLLGGKQSGPHPLSNLVESVAQGVITRSTHVWRQGWPEWRAAGSVPELFADAANATTTAAGAGASVLPQPSGRTNYMTRHWRGEHSLAWSFWINGVAVSLAYHAATIMIAALLLMLATTLGMHGAFLLVFGLGLVGPLLAVWQAVGTWRSASLHEARGGRRFWAILVKILTVFWAVAITISLAVALKDFLKN